jgi:hypothetical protein
MPDGDCKHSLLPDIDDTLANVKGLPKQLPGDPRRQAVSSIYGDVYQAWRSIDAWLRLADADEVIYLEGAEDFDIVKSDAAITVQVKSNTGTISLGTVKARDALENFWTLSREETQRKIDFHFLTTSAVAKEKGGDFDGAKGIELWVAAQTNLNLAIKVAKYLVTKLNANSPLRIFLTTATPQEIQDCLIKRFHWCTNQPDLDAVKLSVNNHIAVLLYSQRRSLSLVSNVRKYLESRFWEIIVKQPSSRRCLTRNELLQQVEQATTTYLPVPIDQLPDLLGNIKPGLNLLNLLLEKSPIPPEPLLLRSELTQRLGELVKHRKAVLLTGTVYKGKTTVAQLISSELCPEAWWVNLTGRRLDQVDNVLLALADRIESGDCPSLVVVDDLDIGPAAHRIYRNSLALVLHRASAAGRGVLVTAQGGTSDSAIMMDFDNIELFNISELTSVEIEKLCIDHGCPQDIAIMWGPLITVWTGGHPKLVQVRLAELASHGWPSPTLTDLTTQSHAMTSAREMARHLLSDSVQGPIAEFIYLVSECSVLMHRTVAIRLSETIEGLTNGGDVLDNLAGKWLERIEGEWFQATSLLKGVVSDVWSSEKRKLAHIRLHDAILAKRLLTPSEAAALLFHAYLGGDSERMAYTAMQLQQIERADAQREIERQLLWLPFVALEAGQLITNDAMAEAILRQLQFRVALTLDSDSLPQICQRWADDIEFVSHSEARDLNRAMMMISVGITGNPKVPLKFRFQAILGILGMPKEILEAQLGLAKCFFERSANETNGLPEKGTTTQMMFLSAIRCIRGLADLEELLQWLNSVVTDDIRQQFDTMLEWPLVQDLGAFVQGAWVVGHEQRKDWEPWISLLERVDEYAKQHNSPSFGREAAKAKAIILTEYLAQSKEAFKVLEQAEEAFGPSPVLMEQRANVLFQERDDESVLEIWSELTSDSVNKTSLDPFAYRRAGMSAARLELWEKAEHIFSDGVVSIQPGFFEITKFGLGVDSALAASRGGDQAAASKLLANAVLSLPPEAAREDNEHWEAAQRIASVVYTSIENCLWKPNDTEAKIEIGTASSPDLKVAKTQPGQAARSEMLRCQVLRLVSTITTGSEGITKELEVLAASKYFLVRWVASEALLALAYSAGAGLGFVEALLAFDKAMDDFLVKSQRGLSPLDPDSGPEPDLPVRPERWFGLLCAGVVCSGPDLCAHLNIWLDTSSRLLGKEAPLTNNIRLCLEGASLPIELLQPVIIDTASSAPIRCGAASQLLQSEIQPANKTLELQSLLTSGLIVDESSACQPLFNRHVAGRFANAWRTHAQSPFQFYSPNTSVPALVDVLDGVEHGSATLKSILSAAADALRQPLGEFMERVL